MKGSKITISHASQLIGEVRKLDKRLEPLNKKRNVLLAELLSIMITLGLRRVTCRDGEALRVVTVQRKWEIQGAQEILEERIRPLLPADS